MVVYFVVFRWFILKFDVKIPGRDDSEDVKLMTKKDYDSKKSASKESLNAQSNDLGKRIYEAVGGIGNMNTIDNCFTRLRIVVNSMDTINEEALKETGSRGLVKRGNEIQITISFGLFNRSLHEPKAQMMCFGMKRINLLRFQRRLSNYGTI